MAVRTFTLLTVLLLLAVTGSVLFAQGSEDEPLVEELLAFFQDRQPPDDPNRRSPARRQPPTTRPPTTRPPTTRPPGTRPPTTRPPTRPSDDSSRRRTRSSSSRGSQRSSQRPIDRLGRVHNMFGDILGDDLVRVSYGFGAAVVPIQQIFNSDAPRPYVAINGNGGFGTDPGLAGGAVPIEFIDVTDGVTVIAATTGFGVDASLDQQADTFPISEPLGSTPAGTGPGTIVFVGGQAVFVGNPAPNTQQTAVDGSVGQARGWNLLINHLFTPATGTAIVPLGASGMKRTKIGDNNSPEPRNRLFFNFNHFGSVSPLGNAVNRSIFGVERVIHGGSSSVEVRVPVGRTLSTRQIEGATSEATEFGDLSLIFKTLIWENDTCLLSGGIGTTLPTADDTRLLAANLAPILQIDNESVHLLPYLSFMHSRDDLFFLQGFVQLDIDVNGNAVRAGNLAGGLDRIGTLQDTTLLYADLGGGLWIYDNPDADGITSVAALLELHYATAVESADTAANTSVTVTRLRNRFDVLNLTTGLSVRLRDQIAVRPAVSIPLRNRPGDRQFNYEAMLQVNCFR